MTNLSKTWGNASGDIKVKPRIEGKILVEIMHLWDNGVSGCCIGFWNRVECDGETEAEFSSVGPRIMNTVYDNGNILLDALIYGQELANVLLKSDIIKVDK